MRPLFLHRLFRRRNKALGFSAAESLDPEGVERLARLEEAERVFAETRELLNQLRVERNLANLTKSEHH